MAFLILKYIPLVQAIMFWVYSYEKMDDGIHGTDRTDSSAWI